MLQKHPEHFVLAAALAVVLTIPFLRAQKLSPSAIEQQSEVSSSQMEALAEAQAEAAQNSELATAVTPEPECTFFTNFRQHSALAPAGLQRVNTFDAEAMAHFNEVSAQTEQVAQALAQGDI